MAKKQKPTRRGHGEGSIYQRPDGTWACQASLGNNLIAGKRIRTTIVRDTRREVADELTRILGAKQRGEYIETSTYPLGEWLDKWLNEYKKAQLRPLTFESYAGLIERHIKPALGKVPLGKLQPHMLQTFYNEKLASGRRDGKGGLSTRMVRYFHAVIREALQQAVKEGLLPRNVADATSPPVIRNEPMRPLTEAELRAFYQSAKDDRLFPAFLLAATTGLRRGELCGLCWDSIDLGKGSLVVQRQLLTPKGEDGKTELVLEDTTKTKAGRRTVSLTDDAVRELKAHRKQQLRERLLLGPAYQDQGFVFCQADGSPTDPRNITKHFQRLLKKAGLPKVRLHDLRHTHASLLLSRGVHPKIVQERLGHSSITMTLDLYSHLASGMDEAAAATLNGLFGEDIEKASDKR